VSEADSVSNYTETPFVTGDSITVLLLADTLHKNIKLQKGTDFILPVKPKIIYSQPLDSMLTRMMHRSDNFYAEQTLLMVSLKLSGTMNEKAAIDSLLHTDLAALPQPPSWADGSGLSRYNLFTPEDFVTILNKMKNEFGMDRLKKIFATGGTGTIRNYYKQDSGFIYAKTGTLTGVVAFSGYLITKKNRLLIFSTLVNNHHSSPTEIRKVIEKFLHQIRDNF
jgi:D-alanyl-D-alanine carboxypeptidase/D-alanyl-D-alanine-endopeptidase (penicillin-binding protein 4)